MIFSIGIFFLLAGSVSAIGCFAINVALKYVRVNDMTTAKPVPIVSICLGVGYTPALMVLNAVCGIDPLTLLGAFITIIGVLLMGAGWHLFARSVLKRRFEYLRAQAAS